MAFPITRMRRLRAKEPLRRMVREASLSADDLVLPLFVRSGRGAHRPIPSLPGVSQLSPDTAAEEAQEVEQLGIPAVILFGIPDTKDAMASESYAENGVVQAAIRAIKEAAPAVIVITDVCLCEYTSHGHCGVVEGQQVLNDPTLELLTRIAVSHAEAGADMVAPSDMMDGRVAAIRRGLDEAGHTGTPILSYAAKYASAFYEPFRDAAESPPQFGDRSSYQMDIANGDEALREVALDIEEGADVVMVKPAMSYLDIIWRVKERFGCPVATYNVSGEYAMVKAAAQNGWLDERRAALEILTCLKRAGADIILTYWAKDAVRWLE